MHAPDSQPATISAVGSTLPERFELASTRVNVSGIELELVHPASADDLISEEEFNQDERLPYWANIWPSARVLARRLAAETGGGRRLVELGCGVGLASLVAAQRGFQVLASDYYVPALEFVALNAERNRLAGVETRMIDFRQLPEDVGRFELVAAADVLYERPYARLMAGAFSRLLKADGLGLLTDPDRHSAQTFVEECRQKGLEARCVGRTIEPDGKNQVTVNLFEVRHAASR